MDSKITYEKALRLEAEAMVLLNLKQIEAKAKNLVADILLSAVTPTMIFSFSGVFEYISPAFSDKTGYQNKDLKGKSIMELIHPSDREVTGEAIGYAARGEPARHFINRFKFVDGSYHWLLWHPQRPANDKEIGVVSMDVLDGIPINIDAGFVGDPYEVETKTWIKEKS